MVGIGLVLVVAGYIGWYNWSGRSHRTVDTVPPLPPRLEETAQIGERLQQEPPPVVVPPEPPAPAAPPPPPPPPPEPPQPRVTLRARADTAVQVRDSRDNNRTLIDRVLRAGESFPVPPRDGLVLTVGLAQNLEVLLDGQPSTLLVGAVGGRRNVSLDAERIRPRQGTPAPAAAQPQRPPAAPPAPAQRAATPPAPATPQGQRPGQPAPPPAPAPARPADPPPGTFVPFSGTAAPAPGRN